MALTVPKPVTAFGVGAAEFVPSPSWRCPFSPQAYRLPSGLTANEWFAPAPTEPGLVPEPVIVYVAEATTPSPSPALKTRALIVALARRLSAVPEGIAGSFAVGSAPPSV